MSRIVTLDVENMGLLGWTWGLYEQNIIHVEHQQHLLTIAWKWFDKNKVEAVSLLDNPKYKKEPHNDRVIAETIWKVLDECDILIGHNIDAFDNKMMNSMFMRHGMKPPSSYRTVDTLKVARKYGKFVSNKLDDLGETFGIGRKLKHEGFPLWLGCENGNADSYKKMIKYNKQDVRLTEDLYKELLPWIGNHPNLSVLDNKPNACGRCGSSHFQLRGTYYTNSSIMQRVQCQNCGGWSRQRIADKIEKSKYVSV